MHLVGLGSASLSKLIALHERAGKWIILFEFEVSRGLVIAESGSDGQIFRAGIEDDMSWLTLWRSHVHCAHIDSIVSASKWNLELQIIGVILRGVSSFTDQLLLPGLALGSSFLLVRCFSGNAGIQINFGARINVEVLING